MEVSIKKAGAASKSLPRVSYATIAVLTALYTFLIGAGFYAAAATIAMPLLAYIMLDTRKGGEA